MTDKIEQLKNRSMGIKSHNMVLISIPGWSNPTPYMKEYIKLLDNNKIEKLITKRKEISMVGKDYFNCLIGNKVHIVAKLGKNCKENFSNIDRIVLNDIYINGVFFRDHAWVKKTKRFKNIQIGDTIQAQATLVGYKDVSGAIKIGLKSFRNIVIVDSLS